MHVDLGVKACGGVGHLIGVDAMLLEDQAADADGVGRGDGLVGEAGQQGHGFSLTQVAILWL